jgi:1,4-dihydroxy-2-naphthoate octaprenyltransferase
MERFGLFVRLVRPLFLLGGFLVYALGVGIAKYLGQEIDWSLYLLGQAWVTTLQLGTHFLNEYYNAPDDQQNNNRTPFSGGSGSVGPGKIERRSVMLFALTCLTVLASLTVLFLANVGPDPVIYLIMGLAFLGAFFYSTPPVRLESSGYGELTTSILVAILVPTFSFVLQRGELHRLLPMATFPLAFSHLAMMIAIEFPDYAADLKTGKHTLLVRMGWKNGILVHNISLLVSYLLVVLAFSFGFPRSVALAAVLTIPFGLLQIWQMSRISAGKKPSWQGLTLNAIVTFGALVYMMAFAFWTG